MAGVHQDPALIRARSDRRVTQGTGILEGLTPELNTPHWQHVANEETFRVGSGVILKLGS
jgi:hypothetical protein